MPRKLKDCEAGKIRNPATNRCVKQNGAIGKKISKGEGVLKTKKQLEKAQKDCEAGKIRNPATNRCVKENGAIGKKLSKGKKAHCECDDKKQMPKGAQCECDDTKKTAASKIVLAVKAKKARTELQKRKTDDINIRNEKTAASKIVLAIKAKKARTELQKRKAAKMDNFKLYNRKTGDNIDVYTTLYEVLDLPLKSSLTEVKKKYRKLALTFHPDKYANKSDSDRLKAQNEIKYINEAYQILGNESYKNRYDKFLEEDEEFLKTIPLSELVRYLIKREKDIEEKMLAGKILKLYSLFEEKENSIPMYFRLKIGKKFETLFKFKEEKMDENEVNKLMEEIKQSLDRY